MTTPIETEQRERVVAAALREKLAEILSDEEVAKVHGYANFGAMTPREVVNDGVRKTAVGYHCGHTQFTILREHGLITKPRPGSYDADLTKKGKAYARALYHDETASTLQQENERLRESLSTVRGWIALDVLEAERAESLTRKDAADLMLKGIDQVLHPLPSQRG